MSNGGDVCLLWIPKLETYFNEIWIDMCIFSFKKMYQKVLFAKCQPFCLGLNVLTHWEWVTHICVSKLTIIGSDYGLSPGRRQAIIYTNAGILLIGPLGTNFSEVLIWNLYIFIKKMHLKMLSGKWRPFYLSLNVLSSCFIAQARLTYLWIKTDSCGLVTVNMSEVYIHQSSPMETNEQTFSLKILNYSQISWGPMN